MVNNTQPECWKKKKSNTRSADIIPFPLNGRIQLALQKFLFLSNSRVNRNLKQFHSLLQQECSFYGKLGCNNYICWERGWSEEACVQQHALSKGFKWVYSMLEINYTRTLHSNSVLP